ncbi:hypothetical protein QC763_111976 [Podospora pseudopauciseta]|uniref:Secreted protein n=1 Tax=Podospora pseudopauciseta TaxID=2093780 RepID=A0ABR0HZN6_9PEZI|nr:hypothetical protein QC763_111976 [Podospora pseudopauciseta]
MPLLQMAWFPPCLIVSSTSSLIAAFQLSPLLHFRLQLSRVFCVFLCVAYNQQLHTADITHFSRLHLWTPFVF